MTIVTFIEWVTELNLWFVSKPDDSHDKILNMWLQDLNNKKKKLTHNYSYFIVSVFNLLKMTKQWLNVKNSVNVRIYSWLKVFYGNS